MDKRHFPVSETDAGKRLDLFLASLLRESSRAAIQRMIEKGLVLVNGRAVKSSQKLHAGDSVEVQFLPASHAGVTDLKPWSYPLQVLFEDEVLIAINKPAHVVTHPGAGVSDHTLANALVAYDPAIQNVGHPLRPGIVHRLDKETSGLLVVAKTDFVYQTMAMMFKERMIEKHYRALAYGVFRQKAGKIDKSLGRDPRDRKKISVRARKSRIAITEYNVLRQLDFAALLDVRILTGRTHQIRVHLASEQHPIVGDSKYGGGNWERIRDEQLRLHLKKHRFFGLHAFSLDFTHPVSGVRLHLEAPLPVLWDQIPL